MSWYSKVSRFVKNHLPTDHINLEDVLRGGKFAASFVPGLGSVVRGYDALGGAKGISSVRHGAEQLFQAVGRKI